jgi:hypothetical protein
MAIGGRSGGRPGRPPRRLAAGHPDVWLLACRRWRRFAVLVGIVAAPGYAIKGRRLLDSQILDDPQDRHPSERRLRFVLAECSHHLDRLDQAPHDIGWRELAHDELLTQFWPPEDDEEQASMLGAALASKLQRALGKSASEAISGMKTRERQAIRKRRVIALCRRYKLSGSWAKLRDRANNDSKILALGLAFLTADNCRKMVSATRKKTRKSR